MLREAIQYLMEQGIKPEERVVEFEDRAFSFDSEGRRHEIEVNYRANDTIELSTLSSLISYIKSKKERSADSLFIHIEDERHVSVLGTIDSDGGREKIVSSIAIVPQFSFGKFYDVETLNIALQSKFIESNDRDIILRVIGNVKEENVKTTGDDGVAQSISVKTGVASVKNVKVPNPVELAPYRTFLEVDQPSSKFIFRMQDGPAAALFEADGGAWRNQAIFNIREYLKEELESEIEEGRVTLLA